jgi:hypothetical protein
LIYPIKLFRKNRNIFLEAISVKTQITPHYLYTPLSSRVGPDVGGLIPKEVKVKQEVPGGPQVTSFEELNPEQGKPWCM